MRRISYPADPELVGLAIVEAPILYHARTRVAVEGKEVERRALVSRDCVGRLLSPEETQNLPQPCGTG
jgi:hypothetical protein